MKKIMTIEESKLDVQQEQLDIPIDSSNSMDIMCGLTVVKPICETKPNTDNNGMGFYIEDKCVIRTLGYIPNEQMIILRDAISTAYKFGYGDASVFLMNKIR